MRNNTDMIKGLTERSKPNFFSTDRIQITVTKLVQAYDTAGTLGPPDKYRVYHMDYSDSIMSLFFWCRQDTFLIPDIKMYSTSHFSQGKTVKTKIQSHPIHMGHPVHSLY